MTSSWWWIRAGTFGNNAGTGAPQLTFGAEIPVGGLTGAGGINVGGAATISGNLTVGGVLTYDDVTNVDSLVLLLQEVDLKWCIRCWRNYHRCWCRRVCWYSYCSIFLGSTGSFTGDVDIAGQNYNG